MDTFTCGTCGAAFQRRPKRGREHRYCSRTCSNRAKGGRDRVVSWVEEDRGYVTPCRIWQGSRQTREGVCYGKVSVDGRTLIAHRYVFALEAGPIPTGHVLDHLCEVPLCVRVDHLEPVTQSENTRRSWQRGRHDAKRAA